MKFSFRFEVDLELKLCCWNCTFRQNGRYVQVDALADADRMKCFVCHGFSLSVIPWFHGLVCLVSLNSLRVGLLC